MKFKKTFNGIGIDYTNSRNKLKIGNFSSYMALERYWLYSFDKFINTKITYMKVKDKLPIITYTIK